MNISLFLAGRLSPNSGRNKGTPAVTVAVTAVALSVAVMLAAIAIVAGFKREITAKVAGFNSHISFLAADDSDQYLVSLTPSLCQILDHTPFVSDYALAASVPAIFKTDNDFQGIYFKSIEGEEFRKFLQSNLTAGRIPEFSSDSNVNYVVISDITARRLGLKTGDRIDTYFITDDVRVRPLKIAGIFNSHFDQYDNVYAFGSLSLIQKIGGINRDEGTSIAIYTDNFRNIDVYSSQLQSEITEALASGLIYRNYRIDNAFHRGAGYFAWLDLLDTNVNVVMALMTFVTAVTLISALLIIILDRKRFIGLLRALGASVGTIRRVFILLAVKITIIGLLIGNTVMIILLWAQYRWHFISLNPESYYIDYVPVELSWQSFLILNVCVILIVWLVLILPSWFVAKISPAETLRYE